MSIQTNINNLHTNIETIKNKISESEYQSIVTVLKTMQQNHMEPTKVSYKINPKIQKDLIKYWNTLRKFYPRYFLKVDILVERIATSKCLWVSLAKYQEYIPKQEFSDLVNIFTLLDDIQICSNRTIYNNYIHFLDNNFLNIINSKEGTKYESIFDQNIQQIIKDKIKVKERNRTIKKVLTFGILG